MDLNKLLGPKKKVSPVEKEAKLDALKGMKKAAGDMMADEFGKMNKVTVAAPDQKGLKQGLEKAEELLEKGPEMSLEDESMETENDEENSKEVAGAIPETMELPESLEDIDALMSKLMEKKNALKGAE